MTAVTFPPSRNSRMTSRSSLFVFATKKTTFWLRGRRTACLSSRTSPPGSPKRRGLAQARHRLRAPVSRLPAARELQVTRTCCGRSLSLGSAAVDGQDDVPGLLLRFDVPGRFDDLLQRVGPIDDRPILPGLDELLQEENVLLSVPRYPERHLLVADPTGQQSQHRDVPHEPEVGF